VVIVLIFLYMVGVIFIVGAEINAALMKFRVLRNFSRTFSVVGRDHAADSKSDKTANIGN
jgi:membrane protein